MRAGFQRIAENKNKLHNYLLVMLLSQSDEINTPLEIHNSSSGLEIVAKPWLLGADLKLFKHILFEFLV